MQIYMVRHYVYDGYAGHDQSDTVFFTKEELAYQYINVSLGYLAQEGYTWKEYPSSGKVFINYGPGQYAYDYYFVQEMTEGEEID